MFKKICVLSALILCVNSLMGETAAGETVEGWFLAGSNSSGYDFNVDETDGVPAPSGYYASNEQSTSTEFGTVMQSYFPEEYLGKRVKMTAWVKSEEVTSWSGLWMRIDAESKNTVSFDNMQNRPIKGDTVWTQYSIVLDIPDDALMLNYGVLIKGKGKVWIDNFEFAIVDDSIPTTDMANSFKSNKPKNNQF